MFEFYIASFFLIFLVIAKVFDFNLAGLLINMLIRVLSGIVFISVCNYIIFLSGRNFHVNINEISVSISAILGMSGLSFLYIFQWILTIM